MTAHEESLVSWRETQLFSAPSTGLAGGDMTSQKEIYRAFGNEVKVVAAALE
jgi:hypothetical protein